MEDENKRKVFVKLVTGPRSVRESHLHNHFAKLKGQIEEVSVTRGRDTAHAWVRFNTPEAAREAVDSYHGTQLYGRFKIIVRPYFSPANPVRQSNTRQHRSVGSSKTRKTTSKPQGNDTQQPRQQQQQQLMTSQPKVHPRRGRVTTAPMSPQVSPNCKPEHDAVATNSKSETAATQLIVASSATEQKEGLVTCDSAAQSLMADYTAKQGSSIINVDSQDSCPWPDIVPATTIEPIFLTEPDDGMLSEPDSSQQPSLNDLLLNPALSAKQIQGTLPYEQSHQCPVPLANASPISFILPLPLPSSE